MVEPVDRETFEANEAEDVEEILEDITQEEQLNRHLEAVKAAHWDYNNWKSHGNQLRAQAKKLAEEIASCEANTGKAFVHRESAWNRLAELLDMPVPNKRARDTRVESLAPMTEGEWAR